MMSPLGLLTRLLGNIRDARRIVARQAQCAEYLRRWENREPGFARCQECREIIHAPEGQWAAHDCRNPNPPITIEVRSS